MANFSENCWQSYSYAALQASVAFLLLDSKSLITAALERHGSTHTCVHADTDTHTHYNYTQM